MNALRCWRVCSRHEQILDGVVAAGNTYSEVPSGAESPLLQERHRNMQLRRQDAKREAEFVGACALLLPFLPYPRLLHILPLVQLALRRLRMPQ